MLLTKSSPPNPRKTRENIDEPSRIIKTIDVISVVLCTAEVRFSRFKLPLLKASPIAPRAPTPAASVGVAIPIKMDPKTATIRTKGGSRVVKIILVLFSKVRTS